MIFGIVMTVIGIFGMVVFSYGAYKIIKTPIEDTKAKFFEKQYKKDVSIKNITNKVSLGKNITSLSKQLDESTEILQIPDDTEFLDLDCDTELLQESDDTEILNI